MKRVGDLETGMASASYSLELANGRGAASAATGAKLRVAYLVNQYPGPSHSFIRREIKALEEQGVEILRFTVRRTKAAALPEEADVLELGRTRVILEAG